jgi:hypothetical protein
MSPARDIRFPGKLSQPLASLPVPHAIEGEKADGIALA